MNNIPRQKLREIILQYGASPNSIPPVVLLARLTKRLQENVSLTEDAARWAVESWGLALGVISEADIASIPSSPTPPKQDNIYQVPSSPPVIQTDKNQSIDNNVKISQSNNLISFRPPAFLIPASERIKFVHSFTLWTLIGFFPMGFVTSLFISAFISAEPVLSILHRLLLLGITSLLHGIATGTAQSVVLRRYLPLSRQWIYVTTIGFFQMLYNIGLVFIFAGIFQWIVLKKHIKNAWKWIFISAGVLMVSYAVGVLAISIITLIFISGTMFEYLGFFDRFFVSFIVIFFAGFSYGFLQAIGLCFCRKK